MLRTTTPRDVRIRTNRTGSNKGWNSVTDYGLVDDIREKNRTPRIVGVGLGGVGALGPGIIDASSISSRFKNGIVAPTML